MAYLLKDISNNIAFNTGSLTANLGTNVVASSTISGLNVGGTYLSNGVSALKIPADSSNNRPVGQTGYIRYNTDTNIIEYWNNLTSSWTPISEPSPSISTITPQYVLQDVSSTPYVITGANFNAFSNVYFIGNNDLTVYPTASTTYISNAQINTLITDAIADASNNSAFAVKVVNVNTGFSSTTANVVTYNKGPVWNTPIGSSLGTGVTLVNYTTSNSPFTDLSASDVAPANNPISYYYYSAPSGASSVLLDASFGRLYGTMPTILGSTLYNFTAYPQDSAGARGPVVSFNFNVSPKTLIYSSGQSLPTPTTDASYSTYIFPWVSGNQTTYSFTSNFNGSVEYLVVAGGGGGANGNGSGGGGGQVLIGTFDISTNIIYTANVGNGGAPYTGNAVENRATNGYISSITGTALSISALGGGAGVSFSNTNFCGNYGGNGGGGGGRDATTASFKNVGGAFAAGGYNVSYTGGAGSANNTYNAGGGGGGAGGNGTDAIVSSNVGGNGGAGVSSSLSGSSLFYGGGGGGGAGGVPATTASGGTGGSSIGGNGGANSGNATSATAGRGAGGGGAGQGNATAGSSGVVILRFTTEPRLFFKYSGYLGAANSNAAVSFNVTAFSSIYGVSPQPTITYSLASGSLPTGLSLNTSTGVISGTISSNPSSTTIYTFTIQASATGYSSVTQSFSIVTYYYLNASLLLGFNNNTTSSGTAATTWSVSSSPNLSYSSSIFRYGGYSGSFNGTSSRVYINTSSAPGNNAAFSISLWLNMTSYNSSGRTYIVDLRNSSPDISGYWLIDSTPGTGMTFTYSTAGTSNISEIQIPYIPSFGQWEHLVWVSKDPTNNYPTLYRNGKVFYQNNSITTGCSWNDTTSSIGTYWNVGAGTNYWLNGYIDNFMIYRAGLSATQVQAIYENTITY